MNQTFGSTYAQAYDLLYLDKDYTAECGLIENVFHRYGDKSISRVLDLGCGTGNHAFTLASRGYEVVGIERSESMLVQAHNKLAHAPTKPKLSYRAGDIRSVKLESEFDAALMMFAVLGYQLENKDVLAALKTARQHVRTAGFAVLRRHLADADHDAAAHFEHDQQPVLYGLWRTCRRYKDVSFVSTDAAHQQCSPLSDAQTRQDGEKRTMGDKSMEWLKPFMTERKYGKGDKLFSKGGAANEMFLTISGKFLVTEFSIEILPGSLMGELGS